MNTNTEDIKSTILVNRKKQAKSGPSPIGGLNNLRSFSSSYRNGSVCMASYYAVIRWKARTYRDTAERSSLLNFVEA